MRPKPTATQFQRIWLASLLALFWFTFCSQAFQKCAFFACFSHPFGGGVNPVLKALWLVSPGWFFCAFNTAKTRLIMARKDDGGAVYTSSAPIFSGAQSLLKPPVGYPSWMLRLLPARASMHLLGGFAAGGSGQRLQCELFGVRTRPVAFFVFWR
ncbi:MAG: hypothetical protein IBX50_09615 [Marinospirillum sp.]|uniref:hypothetical protein n=1 Tax=Marinospirillum sp. TaxID=2183934 RepID=UPI0019FEC234|nr:hypothetical protein [Marinospirillum sp.]MBE0506959.1 hypothetical protein [Marinospirillum sp.]